MRMRIQSARKKEQGQTIILVAIALIALLAMAALAIDVVTLYVARSEAQRVANAGAIAGARMFASSGYTSVQTGGAPPFDACPAATAQALATVNQNTIAGQNGTPAFNCDDTTKPLNPQITVTVNLGGLPTFFARIWGRTSNSVNATATAEAYNPSGQSAPVSTSVKPWLVPNCDASKAGPGNPNCAGSAYFVNPADGSIENNGSFIGNKIVLARVPNTGIPAVNTYYTLQIPINPPVAACPNTGKPSCGLVGSDDYLDNIACFNPQKISCGQDVGPAGINIDNAPGFNNRTDQGTQCLIHAGNSGLAQGQDILSQPNGPGDPIQIDGGTNNPNPTFAAGATNISRSDSIVTVPLYSGIRLCTNVACNVDATVVGFLQLAITQRMPAPNGRIEAIILNVAGCNPAPSGTPISGSGTSPVPVRLINP
jgi:hypothetical protein